MNHAPMNKIFNRLDKLYLAALRINEFSRIAYKR